MFQWILIKNYIFFLPSKYIFIIHYVLYAFLFVHVTILCIQINLKVF